MTLDDQLALASAISEGLSGRALAIVRDDKIVLDDVSGDVEPGQVGTLVQTFVSRRKDAQFYSVVSEGGTIFVHTPDPLARSRGRKDTGELLPENLKKCLWCGFVTPYEELYTIHVRSHGFGL